MCGFTGFLTDDWPHDAGDILHAMTSVIAHRGPDDSGAWFDPEAGVALGHRRLAIIDLTEAGHQPMTSPSGRYVAIYNGEIYNHHELRDELEATGAAPDWRGHSDTEVMLAAIDHWGVRGALERLNGMFAFALWDRQSRTLVLARDRLGEKPLYWGRMGNTLLFGSELKALTQHPRFVGEVDRDSLTSFLRYNYVPGPRTIWRGVNKLLPGHFVEIRERGRVIGDTRPYWDFRSVAEAGAADPLPDTPELVDALDRLLRDSVLRRMEADVPLGALLSGGVDSSVIVALMQAQSSRPVRTFTIGFEDPSFNEAAHAKAVAQHLGTEHVELYVTAQHALDVLPKLPTMWDEPFSDSSQIPTYLVSELTRRHVTVSLSGDGGDELFGGYNRHVNGLRSWQVANRLPGPLKGLLGHALQNRTASRAAARAMRFAPARHRYLGLADRLPKLGQIICEENPDAVYRRLVSHATEPDSIVLGGGEPQSHDDRLDIRFDDFRQKMMYLDTITYLPDDILVKIDRASMAVSLEGRVPFLDHRVVEFAWRLPMSAKIRDGRGKHILRQVLDRYVPRNLIERPKMGFAIPIAQWLAGPLRDWAETMLDPRRIRDEDFFDPAHVSGLWNDFITGRNHRHVELWDILMFQSWWQAQQETGGQSTSPSGSDVMPPRQAALFA